MNQKDKTKFRASKKWKEFRDRIRHEQQKDPVTGAKLTRMANLHHLDLIAERLWTIWCIYQQNKGAKLISANTKCYDKETGKVISTTDGL